MCKSCMCRTCQKTDSTCEPQRSNPGCQVLWQHPYMVNPLSNILQLPPTSAWSLGTKLPFSGLHGKGLTHWSWFHGLNPIARYAQQTLLLLDPSHRFLIFFFKDSLMKPWLTLNSWGWPETPEMPDSSPHSAEMTPVPAISVSPLSSSEGKELL